MKYFRGFFYALAFTFLMALMYSALIGIGWVVFQLFGVIGVIVLLLIALFLSAFNRYLKEEA